MLHNCKRLSFFVALTAALLGSGSQSTTASPLDTGAWYHVARMANGDPGVFNGNGNLKSDYTFGTYTGTLQATDFQRPFDVYDGMNILFVTGDQLYWALAPYATVRSIIDAQAAVFSPNIVWSAGVNGVPTSTNGNILSRAANSEDPWITLSGDHGTGVGSGLMLWGESGWSGSPQYEVLKNAHQGINVFVSEAVSETPLPAALPLFAGGLGVLGFLSRRRKQRA